MRAYPKENNFNSKMVRLEVAGIVGSNMIDCYFNSKMVRLEVFVQPDSVYFVKFQFQNGTIRRKMEKTNMESYLPNFNSKMVRLEVQQMRLNVKF